MTINKIVCQTCLIFLLLIIFFVPQVHSQELKKISVLPFEVYSSGKARQSKNLYIKIWSEELKKEKLVQIIPADDFLQKNHAKWMKNRQSKMENLWALIL